MRFQSILASVALAALSFGCSSSDGLNAIPGVGGFGGFGGFPFGSGGVTQGTGATTASTGGAHAASGGFVGSAGGFVGSAGGATGVSGASGATSTGGVGGGSGATSSGGSAVDAGLDGSADSGLYPAPVLCADPTEKKCGGPCVKPGPADGCSLVTCVDCPSVANGIQTCNGTQCSFECLAGYNKSNGTCIADGSDAGSAHQDGDACSANGDCVSGVCKGGTCQAARCDDKVKNARETDVDCGGNCAACPVGGKCTSNTDCSDGPCTGGTCACGAYTCGSPALAGKCGDTLDDHCGGTVKCGCGSGESCYQGSCCDPQDACTTGCGLVSACGSTVDCGNPCTQGQSCYQSKCCAKLTACPTNACGSASDQCGGTIPCGDCSNGRECKSGKCECTGKDTDGDGIDDCTEADDNDPWTDPAIFNGLVVKTYDACTNNGSCGSINSNSEVDACMAKTVVDQKNMTAGWSFADTAAARCDAAYGFTPDFTKTCNDASFSVSYTGYINLKAGTHCFDISGGNNNACGVFFLDGSDAKPVTHSTGPQCYTVTAGAHAVRLFFDRTNEFLNLFPMGFNWEHCFTSSGTCTPSTSVTQKEVRITN